MKRGLLIVLFSAIGILFLMTLGGCELLLGDNGSGNVSIDLGASLAASRAAKPTDITYYTVTVSAPDMQTIQKTISPGARYINMYVPYGRNRTFRLDAYLDPAVQSTSIPPHEHMLSMADERVVDLLPGQIMKVVFSMGPGEMKLIIPSPNGSPPMGAVIIRIPNMNPALFTYNAANLVTHTTNTDQWAAIGYNAEDLAFDADGTMLIAYYSTSIGIASDITATVTTLATGMASPAHTVTINTRTPTPIVYTYGNVPASGLPNYVIRTILNYKTSPTLGSIPLPAGISTISAQVAVLRYNDGIFYLAGDMSLPRVFRYVYNPSGPSIVMSATSPNLKNPVDLLVKGNYLYVANYPNDISSSGIIDPATIEVFDKNTLAFIGSYGTRTDTTNDNIPGHLFGPHHFVAVTNRKIYFIDDGHANPGKNRIVAVDSVFDWSGWETLSAESVPGNTGSAQFTFWQQC